MSRWFGIDLGTTHSALAALDDTHGRPEPFPVPQTTSPGEVSALTLLPSFIYLPVADELPESAFALPWGRTDNLLGEFARRHGAANPGRLISSSKSWLSHDKVDRRGAILPWDGDDGDIARRSPVEAATSLLRHLRHAWNHAHPDAALEDFDTVLTVPASFDAVARELTVEAARAAGLQNLRLLEEPQAAVYAWLADRGEAWRDELNVGDLLLVCDIGGGTTDFSLIQVQESDGKLTLDRIAVGDNILLGGDNMDLALAYTLQASLEDGGKVLDDWQFRALVHAVRRAKENLLADATRTKDPVVIPSRARRLIGGSTKTELTRETLEAVVLEGFLPRVEASARPDGGRRSALASTGLPYASDAAITRHLSAFLGRESLVDNGHSLAHPTALLFTGGVTKAPEIRERIHAQLAAWLEADGASAPRILSGADADLAVARGAAYYARIADEGGMKIRSGISQSYYVGVERPGLAVPGMAPKLDAVCVAPFAMDEGSTHALDQTFALVLGEPVAFRFFGSNDRREDAPGTKLSPAALNELAPIETILDGTPGKTCHVRLESTVTEVGTLELCAKDTASDAQWALSFDVRGS